MMGETQVNPRLGYQFSRWQQAKRLLGCLGVPDARGFSLKLFGTGILGDLHIHMQQKNL